MSGTHENGERPIIGITMGDPLGVGPEIIIRAWPDLMSDRRIRFVVIGTAAYLSRAKNVSGSNLHVRQINEIDELPESNEFVPCLSVGDQLPVDLPFGTVDQRAGRAAFDYVVTACDLAVAGAIDAVVTAPLSKASIHLAGIEFPGHTEILAERCGVKQFAMMLYVPPGQQIGGEIGLGVVHTTLHQSLRSALDELTTEQILSKCRLAWDFSHAALRCRSINREPRIAVAALNPHAGENGLFGREEIDIIAPAVKAARNHGISCAGPLPCDTLMARAVSGEFDMVVAMYHDQGHIALKLLGMHRAVNVTLGLPIVRTSVAHGTAFEIAGRGTAEIGSLLTAVEVAKSLVQLSAESDVDADEETITYVRDQSPK